MEEIPEKSFLATDKLIFGIGQVSKITGVSSRQLRYWEQQKYISAIQTKKGASRQYNMHTLIRIVNIQRFLNRGFTLSAAVEKALKIDEAAPVVKQFMTTQFKGLKKEADNKFLLDFGYLDNSKKQRVWGIIENGETSFEIEDIS
ncbi:MerR family transcriptional regulator [Lentilactobacillus curieae]|uniref:MerR family transcriptional regulator n=1 Tax=Lentilactobacillus curieae TaxID=1138822 RepID=A0A1S6QG72_9LACO|nr:MerR family transcriptional regulator [Lentilactobacillus curieae]AQW20602.1 MerR family transcriptional regulator [Lentilactobacillus curieae]